MYSLGQGTTFVKNKTVYVICKKNVRQTTETLLRAIMTENMFYERDLHATLKFIKIGYVPSRFALSNDSAHYLSGTFVIF